MRLQLKQLRKSKGFKSRAALAEEIGVPERRVKAWETGESLIQLDDACLVADALGCTLDDLVGRVPPENSLDAQLAGLYDDFAHLSNTGKAAVAAAARGIRVSEADGGEYPPPFNLKVVPNRTPSTPPPPKSKLIAFVP